MSGVLLSIVMPSFNQGAFIAQAVRSALLQGDGEVELVVVDGGSTDDTLPILAALAGEFPGRLRWFSAPDRGPAEAINYAVGAARGKIIGWLNSDDLYARGAIRRALRHLGKNPDHVMVYGHGRHIDAVGRPIGNYPTLPPTAGVEAFAGGCFICQPTVFFRREAFDALGGLDATLRASFDFDLWLRMFQRFPGRIGFIPRVQAYSRLHDQCITRRFRETVALEGMQVVARHLGRAPAHWLLTHVDELCGQHPLWPERRDLQTDVQNLVQRVAPLLSEADHRLLQERMANDRNLQMSTPDFYVTVYPDGWAPPLLELRIRQGEQPIQEIRLLCRQSLPKGRPLVLEIVTPAAGVSRQVVAERGPFELSIPVEDLRPGARLVYRVHSKGWFVPAAHQAHSTDQRQLAFLVEGCELQRAPQPVVDCCAS